MPHLTAPLASQMRRRKLLRRAFMKASLPYLFGESPEHTLVKINSPAGVIIAGLPSLKGVQVIPYKRPGIWRTFREIESRATQKISLEYPAIVVVVSAKFRLGDVTRCSRETLHVVPLAVLPTACLLQQGSLAHASPNRRGVL